VRISKTFDWRCGYVCPCGDNNCERFYCNTHRLLYRSCDTIQTMTERAGWEDGGSKSWQEYTGECPRCDHEWEMARYGRQSTI